ncbi:hypothetical protein DRN85_08030 [Methanosarcinales archaeon]|nr:MAG: hypothetical protein DRN85_08030 [Methanosarcinales archaeon]
MDGILFDRLVGGFLTIMGLLFWIFHKRLANKTADFYYKLLHIQFSETGYKIGFLVGGISFFIFGLLAVFGIIRFK